MSVEVLLEKKMGVFKWLVVLIGCMAAGVITSLYLVGYQQKQAAIAFWLPRWCSPVRTHHCQWCR